MSEASDTDDKAKSAADEEEGTALWSMDSWQLWAIAVLGLTSVILGAFQMIKSKNIESWMYFVVGFAAMVILNYRIRQAKSSKLNPHSIHLGIMMGALLRLHHSLSLA